MTLQKDKYIYPEESDLRTFVEILKNGKYMIGKYLPSVDDGWYVAIGQCVKYVEEISVYETCTFFDSCARLLYKIAKRHELGDGNKRSSVIVVYLFCLLNDYRITDPEKLKKQAKRIAKTKGRKNEDVIRTRVSGKLQKIIVPFS